MEAPVQGLPRLVTRKTELGGTALEAGSIVMLRFGAANRDEREFEDPDVVDIDRPKAGRQLAFGSGIHHCIGAALARQELNLGFAALLDAFDGFRLADGADPEAEPSFILRNLPRLRVRYRQRAPGACAVEVSRQRNFHPSVRMGRDRQVAQARAGVAEPPGR